MFTTSKGYDLFELLCALQKCIRRGMEYEAVHFAVELEEFNATAFWNRLKIIASEDIGCANAFVPVLIETLLKEYQVSKGKLNDDSYKLFLFSAVVCLSRSPKSRIIDDLLNVVYAERELENKWLKIPDFALDLHTKQGIAKGCDIEHFYFEGNLLENEAFENP